MELWEFNCCVRTAQQKKKEEGKENFANAWLMANLTNAAMAGKLKPLKYYLEEKQAETITYDEFEELLEKAERGNNGT